MRLLHDAALRSDCAPAAEETRSSEPVAVLQPEEEAAVEEAPPLAYTGAPLVLAAPDASPETLALLRRCGDLGASRPLLRPLSRRAGWVERMRAPSVEADPAQAVLLLADTLQRRSARRLCARTLTYARVSAPTLRCVAHLRLVPVLGAVDRGQRVPAALSAGRPAALPLGELQRRHAARIAREVRGACALLADRGRGVT